MLTDQAVANILQIALIINIGAALANSGINDIFSTPGGSSNPGAIGTGDATAIGNDTDQYVTQAARTEATQEMDDFANQLAISLWLGLAQANSGLNAITGTGVSGSGGSVGAGDATAIGNDSLTAISQRAAAVGSGTSQTDITQRATVLNLGFALANSGLNSISGVAGGLLSASDADDDAVAEDLFAMLLPALLQSYGYGPGAGSGAVNTGDATAIGNQSETYVAQIAAAASSGDGLNSIVQEVLVANMGAAGANTGANTLGSARASLDPQTAEAVVKMAAFLASMLVDRPPGDGQHGTATAEPGHRDPLRGPDLPDLRGARRVRHGADERDGRPRPHPSDLHRAQPRCRHVEQRLQRRRHRAGAGTGPRLDGVRRTSRRRQLGARRDRRSGDRCGRRHGGRCHQQPATPSTPVTSMAGNVDNLVIICQRINSEDVDCLAPPPPRPRQPHRSIPRRRPSGGGDDADSDRGGTAVHADARQRARPSPPWRRRPLAATRRAGCGRRHARARRNCRARAATSTRPCGVRRSSCSSVDASSWCAVASHPRRCEPSMRRGSALASAHARPGHP